jgi:hypothetical protein
VGDPLVAGEADEGVECGLEPEQDSDAAGRGLQAHLHAAGVGGLGATHDVDPLRGDEVALHPREPERVAGRRRAEALEHVELALEALGAALHVEVAHRLQHAATGLGHRPRERRELLLRGLRGGRVAAVDRTVIVGAAGREADGARPHRVAHDGLHRAEVVGRGGAVGDGAIAHHVDAERVVREVGRHVHRARPGVDVVEVLAEGLPLPLDALGQRRARDVLDALEELDEALVIGGTAGREADAAIAHHRGGHAVGGGGEHVAVPARLAVVVRVHVHEPGGDDRALGVERARRGLGDLAERDDLAVANADVGALARRAGAIDESAVLDEEVEHGTAMITAWRDGGGGLSAGRRTRAGEHVADGARGQGSNTGACRTTRVRAHGMAARVSRSRMAVTTFEMLARVISTP